jgi:TPR repeat protein
MQHILTSMPLIFLLSFFSAGCSAQETAQISSCDDACVIDLEKKALLGDASSADRLITHYNYVDPSQIRFWEQIAAENGDLDAQRGLAHAMLIYSKDSRDHIRGVYWLEKAARAGYKPAMDDLARYRKGGAEAILPDPSKPE